MRLNDLSVFPHFRGAQYRQLFENGYGISVIPEIGPSEEPLYEVAVLKHTDGKRSHLYYESEITSDVVRFCTENAVDTLIERIRNLPSTQ